MKIEVIVGNIVKQPDVEAVVNSANANLRLGSGVAGPFIPPLAPSWRSIASLLRRWPMALFWSRRVSSCPTFG